MANFPGTTGDDVYAGTPDTDNIFDGGGGNDSLAGAGGDDFNPAEDVIDLGAVDADATVGGDQAFALVTGAGALAAGQARLTYDPASDRTLFEGEVNGAGGPDLVFLIAGDVTSGAEFLL